MDIGEETLRRINKMDRFNEWLFDTFRPYLGKRVLEVGCGSGNLTYHLIDHCETLIAIDISENYIETIRERFPPDKVQAFCFDIQDREITKLSRVGIDTIVCLNVLEHIKDDDLALENMFEMLQPGGRLILFVPALKILYGTLDKGLDHYRRYSKGGLSKQLRGKGFIIEKDVYMNFFGIFGWFLNGKIGRRNILPTDQLLLYNKLVPLFRFFEKMTGPPIGQSLLFIANKFLE